MVVVDRLEQDSFRLASTSKDGKGKGEDCLSVVFRCCYRCVWTCGHEFVHGLGLSVAVFLVLLFPYCNEDLRQHTDTIPLLLLNDD